VDVVEAMKHLVPLLTEAVRRIADDVGLLAV
jgi:hypothetical protein